MAINENKKYAYHNFTCGLHEKGIAQSRADYIKNK
jgi:hypothetical protein